MKYRKKPVVIEAFQWIGNFNIEAWPLWFQTATHIGTVTHEDGSNDVQIHTKEGVMTAKPDDWIIQGVQGVYPCKPDIFAATYEPAE